LKRVGFTLFIILFLFLNISFAQVSVAVTGLLDNDARAYSGPLATYLGTYFNSNGYYTAEIPETFRFKFSIRGLYSLISNDQKTFTPTPVSGYSLQPTATIFGNDGGVFLGPDGFRIYPTGFNASSIPLGIYQASGSLYGTELMLRFFPNTKIGDTKTGLWGIGISHSISQWIPKLPIDFAIQVMYNNFDLEYSGGSYSKYLKVGSKNFALNVHLSKTFSGMFIVYGGMQYESSTMNLEYVFTDPNGLYSSQKDTHQKISVDGDNEFRLTAGGAIKLAVIVLNADVNLTSMFTVAGGITLEL